MTANQPSVLFLCDYYLPGYKAGGVIRTVANTVNLLGADFHFKVITRDRDFDDSQPYPDLKTDCWQSVGKAEVFYLKPSSAGLTTLCKIIKESQADILYINSVFSPTFAIKPLLLRRLNLIPSMSLIIAPRGELSKGALAIKSWKKNIYLNLAKSLGFFDRVIWQASTKYEAKDIYEKINFNVTVQVAEDLSIPLHQINQNFQKQKKPENLKIIYLSRITPKKNLDFALKILALLHGEVEFNIYGAIDDSKYWEGCQKIINFLPNNIKVKYQGCVTYERVAPLLAEHHLFFLPTLGENFGHAILEALVAGCPVLISDQTPWRDLQSQGAGWDFPLEQPKDFQNVLQRLIAMDATEYQQWARQARDYGIKYSQNTATIQNSKQLLYQSLN